MRTSTVSLVSFLIWAISCSARTICVDANGTGDYPTIQAAIDDANDGDVVVVQPGTYTGDGNRDIDFHGKMITVRSTDPNDPNIVAATIIDCQSKGCGFRFFGGQANTILAGLTITNGYIRGCGAAIYCWLSSPTISKCRIIGNSAADGEGGAIACDAGAEPTIIGCTILRNSANYGGGIHSSYSYPKIINSVVAENTGGGISAHGGHLEVDHCTITNSIITAQANEAMMSNCIVWGSSISVFGESDFTISYSDIEGGKEAVDAKGQCKLNWLAGNIDADPCFLDVPSGDYHLSLASPCINAGDPCYSSGPGETDLDGQTRIINGRVDIGADEVNYEGPIIEVTPRQLNFYAIQGEPNPQAQVVSIRNNGLGLLNWDLIEDCWWLQVDPKSGQSSGDSNDVAVSIDVSGMTGGSYSCELIIGAEGTLNSSVMVPVNLEVHGELHVPSSYSNIQAAIDAAWQGDVIIVAPGTYTGQGNHDIDFKAKAIAVRSTNPSDPNIVKTTIIDCRRDRSGYRGFYFHSGENKNSRLEGFTITGGRQESSAGGAIFCRQSSPSISNCVMKDNCAYNGGAMYLEDSNATITNCQFIGNLAYYKGGGLCAVRSALRLVNCIFNANSARDGGAICNCSYSPGWPWLPAGVRASHGQTPDHNAYYSPVLINYSFSASAAGNHGVIPSADIAPTFVNCEFSGNVAEQNGGGIYNHDQGTATLINCTFTGNRAAGNGGAIYVDVEGAVAPTNCIFWGDAPEEFYLHLLSGVSIVAYSDIQDGWPGITNLSVDPHFVHPGHWDPNGTPDDVRDDFWIAGDYHLKSQGGRWDPISQSWVQDEVTSPCIDAGDPSSPIGFEPFPNAGIVNMGAYGGTAEASKSYFGGLVCETIIAGDINGDCKVDFADFTIMAFHWLEDGRL